MNIHLPAILMWTTGVQGFDTLPYVFILSNFLVWFALMFQSQLVDQISMFAGSPLISQSCSLLILLFTVLPDWNGIHIEIITFFSGLRWIEHFNFWLKSTCLSMLRKSQGAVWPAASYAGAKAAIERGRCREHCFWTPDRCRLRQLAGYSLVGRG